MWMRSLFFLAVLLCAGCLPSPDDRFRPQPNLPRQYFGSDLDLPFSEAVRVGDTLYLSGNGGLLPGTRTVPDDPREEAVQLMENFKATLEKADMNLDNLVTVTVYCSDLSLYPVFNEVYRSYFDGPFPARAFISSPPLLFGMRFEMQGVAVRKP